MIWLDPWKLVHSKVISFKDCLTGSQAAQQCISVPKSLLRYARMAVAAIKKLGTGAGRRTS